jgi:hypothetical protein
MTILASPRGHDQSPQSHLHPRAHTRRLVASAPAPSLPWFIILQPPTSTRPHPLVLFLTTPVSLFFICCPQGTLSDAHALERPWIYSSNHWWNYVLPDPPRRRSSGIRHSDWRSGVYWQLVHGQVYASRLFIRSCSRMSWIFPLAVSPAPSRA